MIEQILFPVGRLVQGSLYTPNDKDYEGNPLVDKSGNPRVEYYFSLAVPKKTEVHWNETPWGSIIWRIGQAEFPGGQAKTPHFAWKIINGDDTTPNRKGTIPSDNEGFSGHWVLRMVSGYAPQIVNENGSAYILEPDYIKAGDYIEVFGEVTGNRNQQQSGVFLRHKIIAFRGFGERIQTGVDPKNVGFGQGTVPAGASKAPAGSHIAALSEQAAASPPPPAPYPDILNGPPKAPVRVMLPAAGGHTYEQLIAAGWTDQLLIQHGMMQA